MPTYLFYKYLQRATFVNRVSSKILVHHVIAHRSENIECWNCLCEFEDVKYVYFYTYYTYLNVDNVPMSLAP